MNWIIVFLNGQSSRVETILAKCSKCTEEDLKAVRKSDVDETLEERSSLFLKMFLNRYNKKYLDETVHTISF